MGVAKRRILTTRTPDSLPFVRTRPESSRAGAREPPATCPDSGLHFRVTTDLLPGFELPLDRLLKIADQYGG